MKAKENKSIFRKQKRLSVFVPADKLNKKMSHFIDFIKAADIHLMQIPAGPVPERK